MKRFLRYLVFILVAGPVLVFAESQEFGDIEINYTIFNSSFLQPAVASSYGITRAYDSALINISVLQGDEPGQSTLAANITGTWYDLIHKKELEFKEIREQDAVYYIAQFPIDHRTSYYFDLVIKVGDQSYPLQFNKTLYVDGK